MELKPKRKDYFLETPQNLTASGREPTIGIASVDGGIESGVNSITPNRQSMANLFDENMQLLQNENKGRELSGMTPRRQTFAFLQSNFRQRGFSQRLSVQVKQDNKGYDFGALQ